MFKLILNGVVHRHNMINKYVTKIIFIFIIFLVVVVLLRSNLLNITHNVRYLYNKIMLQIINTMKFIEL